MPATLALGTRAGPIALAPAPGPRADALRRVASPAALPRPRTIASPPALPDRTTRPPARSTLPIMEAAAPRATPRRLTSPSLVRGASDAELTLEEVDAALLVDLPEDDSGEPTARIVVPGIAATLPDRDPTVLVRSPRPLDRRRWLAGGLGASAGLAIVALLVVIGSAQRAPAPAPAGAPLFTSAATAPGSTTLTTRQPPRSRAPIATPTSAVRPSTAALRRPLETAQSSAVVPRAVTAHVANPASAGAQAIAAAPSRPSLAPPRGTGGRGRRPGAAGPRGKPSVALAQPLALSGHAAPTRPRLASKQPLVGGAPARPRPAAVRAVGQPSPARSIPAAGTGSPARPRPATKRPSVAASPARPGPMTAQPARPETRPRSPRDALPRTTKPTRAAPRAAQVSRQPA
jgi:hypothetical protein